MHHATPAPILALWETLGFREAAFQRAKEIHGIYSPQACKALAAFDAAQDDFDTAYNEFLVTAKNAEAAKVAALKADADGSAKTVKALRAEALALSEEADALKSEINSLKIELKDANARLDEVSAWIKANPLHLTEQAHKAFAVILYQNSL